MRIRSWCNTTTVLEIVAVSNIIWLLGMPFGPLQLDVILIHTSRAVKFIRDQANVAISNDKPGNSSKDRLSVNTAQLAASALRKMLKGDNNTKISLDISRDRSDQTPGKVEPLDGWAEGVSLRKSHCCLLLKPQIVLRGDTAADTCIVAAAQAKLQSFAIMDLLNLDDPISGKVMSR